MLLHTAILTDWYLSQAHRALAKREFAIKLHPHVQQIFSYWYINSRTDEVI